MIFTERTDGDRVPFSTLVLISIAVATLPWLASATRFGPPTGLLPALTATLVVWPFLYRLSARSIASDLGRIARSHRHRTVVVLVATGIGAVTFMAAELPWATGGALLVGAMALAADSAKHHALRRADLQRTR